MITNIRSTYGVCILCSLILLLLASACSESSPAPSDSPTDTSNNSPTVNNLNNGSDTTDTPSNPDQNNDSNNTPNEEKNNEVSANNSANNTSDGNTLISEMSADDVLHVCDSLHATIERLYDAELESTRGLCKMLASVDSYHSDLEADESELESMCADFYSECISDTETGYEGECLDAEESESCDVSLEQIIKCFESDLERSAELWTPYANMSCDVLTEEEMVEKIMVDLDASWPDDNPDCEVVEEQCPQIF